MYGVGGIRIWGFDVGDGMGCDMGCDGVMGERRGGCVGEGGDVQEREQRSVHGWMDGFADLRMCECASASASASASVRVRVCVQQRVRVQRVRVQRERWMASRRISIGSQTIGP